MGIKLLDLWGGDRGDGTNLLDLWGGDRADGPQLLDLWEGDRLMGALMGFGGKRNGDGLSFGLKLCRGQSYMQAKVGQEGSGLFSKR